MQQSDIILHEIVHGPLTAFTYHIYKDGRLVAQYVHHANDFQAVVYVLSEARVSSLAEAAGYRIEEFNESTGERRIII